MDPSPLTVSALVLGLLLLALAVWERAGRGAQARAWLRAPRESGIRRAMFVFPGIGVLSLLVGLSPWMEGTPLLGLLALVLAPLGLWLVFGWGALALPYPRWSVPGWARETIGARFGKERWTR
ncbi:hypothetical protein SGUI_0686 [Serinicoccus hydrothermalis]|uniref:Uncharacterized protein n=1 Tax=Serinicoccus hydrothermalis TaxID=1758689 RepID=A0A1B1N9G5_9MICO|nr:hypothetical protein [Serinicoccus hydrothermalis]ANS78082.1 hypothetical protein SGUI_0686 [Serinicoccus hydrothermalis]